MVASCAVVQSRWKGNEEGRGISAWCTWCITSNFLNDVAPLWHYLVCPCHMDSSPRVARERERSLMIIYAKYICEFCMGDSPWDSVSSLASRFSRFSRFTCNWNACRTFPLLEVVLWWWCGAVVLLPRIWLACFGRTLYVYVHTNVCVCGPIYTISLW